MADANFAREPQINTTRLEQIDDLLRRLDSLDGKHEHKYAVEQNGLFYTAARSVWSYIRWLWRSSRIDGSQLLEVNELLPGLDDEMHRRITTAARRSFPGLLRPIIERMIRNIYRSKDSRVRVLDIGSGGMEIERQIMQGLLEKKYPHRVSFVGVDVSPDALSRAARNITELGETNVHIKYMNRFDREVVEDFEQSVNSQFVVLLCQASVDDLIKICPQNYFSFAFTSLFLHHIPRTVRAHVLSQINTLAHDVVHYDGYRSSMNLIPQSIVAWHHPVFLNAAIFSNLRYMNKNELRNFHTGSTLRFCAHGHYLSEEIPK